MTLVICNMFAAGCSPDWDGISALATTAATAAALFIPPWQRKRDQRDKQQALAYALFLKMMKIHSDVHKLWLHVLEQRELATSHGAPIDSWGFFRPIANLPSPVKFTTDEMAMLFAARDDDAFNAVLSMDDVHTSAITTMRVYGERRDDLTKLLPGGNLNGVVGSSNLTAEEHDRLAPFSAQLDMLVADMAASFERFEAETKDALRQLHRVATNNFHLKVRYTLTE